MRIKKLSLWSAVAVLSLVASLACEKRVHAQVTETLVLAAATTRISATYSTALATAAEAPLGLPP